MKFSSKVLLSVCVAVLLEVVVFNFDVWGTKLKAEQLQTAAFSLEDLTPVNWYMEDGVYISDVDPQLFVPTDPMWLSSVSIQYITEPQVTDCAFYYSNPDQTVSVLNNIDISDGQTVFKLDKEIGPILRVDLGEEAGVRLSAIRVIINPMPQLHISISRIVAVVMIYVCGSLLFRIQRMPDYTHYIQKKEENV